MEKKKFLLLPIVAIIAAAACFVPSANADDVSVTYSAHVQNIGDQTAVSAVSDTSIESPFAGTSGQGLRVEALKINLNTSVKGVKIQYAAHVQNIGWQDFVSSGKMAGTSGQGLRVEGIAIAAPGLEEAGYTLKYRAHVENIGWQDWRTAAESTDDIDLDDEADFAGTSGLGLRVEAIEIALIPNEEKALENAKEAAKDELKAFVASDELAAKTIGTKKNSVVVGVKAAIDDAKAAYKNTTGSIDNADDIDEVNEIVEDCEKAIVDALKEYLADAIKAYKNETVVTDSKVDYIITEDDYYDVIDAIDETETLADAIAAYNAAMDARVNLSDLREAAQDLIGEYVAVNGGLNKLVLTAKEKKNTTSTTKTYAKEAVIKAAIDAAKDALETADYDELDELIEDGIENILDTTVAYAKAKLDAVYAMNDTEAGTLILDEDDYLDYKEAIEDATTELDAIDAYENAALGRVSAYQYKLDELKENLLEQINDDFDLDELTYTGKEYTINASDYTNAVETAIKAINKVKLSAETSSAYNTAVTKLGKAIVTLYGRFDDEDADDYIVCDADYDAKLVVKQTLYTKALADFVEGTTTAKTYATAQDIAGDWTIAGYDLTAIKNLDGDSIIEVDAIASIYEEAVEAIEECEDLDVIDDLYDDYSESLVNAIRSTLTNEMTAIYNNALIYDVSEISANDRGYFIKDNYRTKLALVKASDATVETMATAYAQFVATVTPFVSETAANDIIAAITAVDTIYAGISSDAALDDIKDELIDALDEDDAITKANADTLIENAKTDMVKTLRNYVVDQINELIADVDADSVYASDITNELKSLRVAVKSISNFTDIDNIAMALVYAEEIANVDRFTVTYKEANGTVISTEHVVSGEDAEGTGVVGDEYYATAELTGEQVSLDNITADRVVFVKHAA